jgi:hypothetical protein
MPDVAQIWNEVLPSIKEGVTGVGVWTALNMAKPLVLEGGQIVLGLPHEAGELAGHLKLSATKRLIEQSISGKVNAPVTLRVIDGVELADWEVEKRRDAEKARLNEQSMNKMRAEMQSRSNWESIYEQLSRKYAAVSNKSLPQNRARFLEEAVELIAEARRSQTTYDELGERNFARCLERLAQYSELPSTLVASQVLQRAGEL